MSRSLAPAPPRGQNPGQIWVAVLNINTWEHRRNPCICTFCLLSECVVQKKYKSFIYILSSMMLGSDSSFRVLNSAEKADGVSGQKCWDNLNLGQGGLRATIPFLYGWTIHNIPSLLPNTDHLEERYRKFSVIELSWTNILKMGPFS